jgi:hypothetical protein
MHNHHMYHIPGMQSRYIYNIHMTDAHATYYIMHIMTVGTTYIVYVTALHARYMVHMMIVGTTYIVYITALHARYMVHMMIVHAPRDKVAQ